MLAIQGLTMIQIRQTLLNLSFITFCLLFLTHNVNATVLIPDPPKINATAYVLMDAKTGDIITSYNADEKVPPASLTKMMTSYIVTEEIRKGNISEDDTTVISIKAWKAEGSRMFIKEGTSVSIMDLLKGVIIQSGNDASIALAEYVAGDENSFADLMNRYALEMGMENTHYVNSTGLPDPDHYTTANDLAKLGRATVYEHPKYYRLYSQKSFTYNNITQANRNSLIFGDLPVDGIKTGHTEEAGYCLVASAEENNTRLISVVLGTESNRARASESKKLLTYGFRFYETAELYKPGDVVDEQTLWMGKNERIQLGVAKDLLLTIPKGSKKDLSASIDVNTYIKAPITKGQKLGSLKISLNGKIIAQEELIALTDEEKGGIFKQLIDFIKIFFSRLF